MSYQTSTSSRTKSMQQENSLLSKAIWEAHQKLEQHKIKDIRVYDSEDNGNSKKYMPISQTMVFRLTHEGQKLFETVKREFEETKSALTRSNPVRLSVNKALVRGSAESIFEQAKPHDVLSSVSIYRSRRRNNWNPS